MIFLISLPLLLVSLFLFDGALRFGAVALSVFLLNLGAFLLVNRLDRRNFAYKFYVADTLLVSLFLCLNVFFFRRQTEELLASTSLFDEIPWSLLSLSLVPMVALAFALFIGKWQSSYRRPTFDGYFKEASPAFDIVSLLLVVPVLGGWIAQIINVSFIEFWLAILNKTFVFFPFIAGYRYRYNRPVWFIWAAVLSIGVVVAALTGNRGLGFFPAFYFAIGFGLSFRRKYLYFAGLTLAMVGALYLSGISGAIRETIGRKTISDFNLTELVQAWPEVVRYMTTDTDKVAGAAEADPFYKGLKRMVYWTRIVIPNLAGDVVPYRGLEDLGGDYKAFFYFSKLTGITGVQFYPSVMHASPYGFTVNMGTTKAISTVPFNSEMDGWTRGGFAVAALYSSILVAAMALLERLNQRMHAKKPDIRLLCLAVIWGLPFSYFGAAAFIHCLRQYILQFAMVVVLAHILSYLAKKLRFYFPQLNQRVLRGRLRGK